MKNVNDVPAGTRVRLTPKSTRARNRVSEHGCVMELKKTKVVPKWHFKPSIFVKSLDGKWFGWFTEDEAECNQTN